MDQNIPPQNQDLSVVTNTSTTSNTPKFAGFWRRFFAQFIDGFFMFLISIPLSLLVGGDVILGASSGVVLNLIYCSVFLCSDLMSTPGKAILGMAVVNEENQTKLSFKSAIIRVICAYFSSMILLLGYLIQPFTAKRQTLHDMIAKTIVIKKEPPEVNYFTVFADSFKKILGN